MKAENLPVLAEPTGRPVSMHVDGFIAPEPELEQQSSGLNVRDLLFMLCRHKLKIALFAAGGILAAISIYFFVPASYESTAKLLVRYVVDRSAIDGLDSAAKEPSVHNDNLLNSEVEILTSWDLARDVAAAVGVDRLLPGTGGKATLEEATQTIVRGLDVALVKETNIISVGYRAPNAPLAKQVLEELVKRYFDKHLEIHRSTGAFDFVTRQADQVHADLIRTEEELKQLKEKAGITSLAESTATIATDLTKCREELDAAESELVAQKARVNEIEKSLAGVDSKQPASAAPTAPQASNEVVEEYKSLVTRIDQLRQSETELLSRYTAQNRIVKVKQSQIADLDKQRRNLAKKYPELLAAFPTTGSGSPESPRPDLVSERATLIADTARVESLKSRLANLEERAKRIAEVEPQIAQLERKRDVEEANYKYFGASLEKARIDETLDPSRMPNISIVQRPTPGEKVTRKLQKIVIGLAVGGLGMGIAIALLIELVLDRTVKRSLELETRLRIPLLLAIPYFGLTGQRLRLRDSRHDSETDLHDGVGTNGAGTNGAGTNRLASENGELLRPFCEAIRDRLGMYFEMNRMTHKPKLVAVTGLSKNAGASTLAAGLAASLSEASDGKVLLVDKPVGPKKFYDMMTQFKASNFDYVIFDLPSLGDTGATLPMAGFMDKVLLVVEAEKSNRDAVKRAYSQLCAKSEVSVIFNKSRSYGPKWLEGEI